MNIFEWAPEHIETLMALSGAGLSARKIGEHLGITRNAVIGKLHRLGIVSPKKPGLTAEERAEKERLAKDRKRELDRARRPTRLAPYTPPMVRPEAPIPLGIPFGDLADFKRLSPNQCRFMGSEEPATRWSCCAHETLPGQPFCEYHRALSYWVKR